MKFSFRLFISLFLLLITGGAFSASAQSDFFVGQVTTLGTNCAVRGMSANGRLVLFQSTGDHSTQLSNRNNADGNLELFLYDYAQRRIFQITNTKSLLKDTTKAPTFDNVKVDMVNVEASLSADGRWVVFASNATTSVAGSAVNGTNPGNFDGNTFTTGTGTNPLTSDGNTEIWLYAVPPLVPVDLTSGAEIPVIDLSQGTFTQVTNTIPSRLPIPGQSDDTGVFSPFVPWDARETSISDDGSVTAFVSNRDVVAGGNSFPNDDNTEVYTFRRAAPGGACPTLDPLTTPCSQITKTPRNITIARSSERSSKEALDANQISEKGTKVSVEDMVSAAPEAVMPVFNQNPSISGDGLHLAFFGNGVNPILTMTGGNNSDANGEVFYTDLNSSGAPTGTKKQLTETTRPTLDVVVNTFSGVGKRISRTGRYIAFESIADLSGTGGNQVANTTFLYDTTLTGTAAFRQVGPRGNADPGAAEGDILRAPTFTDYDGAGLPRTLLFASRLNFKADGTIPGTATDGLNSDEDRPAQFFSYPLDVAATAATITRLSKFPSPGFIVALQPIPSETHNRIAFNVGNEMGTGNPLLANEVFYLLVPNVSSESPATYSFLSGATSRVITVDAVPTPTPTATPTPTPTPTVTPSPTPTPTPVTPSATRGISRGMLVEVNIISAMARPFVPTTGIGANFTRAPALPMELNGVSVSIDGAACGLKSIDRKKILLVAPQGLSAGDHNLIVNNNGLILTGKVFAVEAQPDIFAKNMSIPGTSGGRTRALNVTNRVQTGEPFVVRTVKIKGGLFVDSVIRIYMTGIHSVPASAFTVRLKDKIITGSQIATGAVLSDEPGIYYFDFRLGLGLLALGDSPVVVSINSGTEIFESRLDDTTSFIRIL